MSSLITPTVAGGTTSHPLIGEVKLRVHPDTRKVTFRWTAGTARVTIPRGLTASQVASLIDRIAPKLARMKPSVEFYDGKVIDTPFVSLRYEASQSVAPSRLIGRIDRPTSDGRRAATISFHQAADTDDPAFQNNISRYSAKVAAHIAGNELLQMAADIADRVNVHPRSWTLGSGTRVLGSCSSLGRITLSRYLLFFPTELVEYIIIHELAHLIHHDHSPRFHSEVNRMCGGREAELQRQLRDYKWPILR